MFDGAVGHGAVEERAGVAGGGGVGAGVVAVGVGVALDEDLAGAGEGGEGEGGQGEGAHEEGRAHHGAWGESDGRPRRKGGFGRDLRGEGAGEGCQVRWGGQVGGRAGEGEAAGVTLPLEVLTETRTPDP